MRPTDERGRPIYRGLSGGLLAGDATRSARGLRGGRAAGFTRREAGFDIGCTNWHFVLSVVEKPSSQGSLVYCGLYETESVLHWF